MEIKDVLKNLRKVKGISQVKLAEDLGVSAGIIGMYESGKRKPSYEALEAIADYFNVTIDYLTGRESGSMYYLDPEVAELANEMASRPELKALMDASRKLTKEDLEDLEKIVNKLNRE